MDAEQLRSIREAQSRLQEKTLNAVMDRMDCLFSSLGTTSTAAPATTTELVTNSLSSRLLQFSYDPENGCTFNVWFSRYDDMIAKDGSTMDDAAKARLIVWKYAASYARFTNHILPSKPSDISMEEAVKTLKELFGHNTSVFARRYAYLRTQCNGESLRDYLEWSTNVTNWPNLTQSPANR